MLINNRDTNNIDYSLLLMIVVPQYALFGQHIMCLAGVILCISKHMLININTAYHSTDITMASI
jgi:hypothetical protein